MITTLTRQIELIKASKKPMFIAGGGVRYSEAGQTAMDFCKAFNIPVSQTQAGHSCLPDSFELAVGGIGVTGGLAANALCKDCDLVIDVGTRFNDFVTGSKWVLFRNPDIKVLAINTSEFHAEKLDATRCIGDAKVTLEAIMGKAQGRRLQVRLHHRNSGYPQGLGKKSVCAFWAFSTRARASARASSYRAFPAGPKRS